MPCCFPSSILCFGDFQLACFGALKSLANEQAFIHLARMDKAVFLNLQGNLGVCFFVTHCMSLRHPIFEVRPGYATNF